MTLSTFAVVTCFWFSGFFAGRAVVFYRWRKVVSGD